MLIGAEAAPYKSYLFSIGFPWVVPHATFLLFW